MGLKPLLLRGDALTLMFSLNRTKLGLKRNRTRLGTENMRREVLIEPSWD
ncbi:hypothetical protein THTE_4412 [Thermogutta terrifontis]|uniref:Uncharacterized protein n=1 Tax=Thermogutta terrifontis TaxID=1331910 RepID=A0A286RM08_9BACT|nr:hypothetical protein THTE_4412 [Thermogutta terrifontis]